MRQLVTVLGLVACAAGASSDTRLMATVISPNLRAGSQYQLIFVSRDAVVHASPLAGATNGSLWDIDAVALWLGAAIDSC